MKITMNLQTLKYSVNLLRNTYLGVALQIERNYAKAVAPSTAATKKKKLGKLGPIVEKKVIPVETDTNKLVNFVCGSNIKTSGTDIKIKPDSEYPDWLWNLNVDRIIPLEELDPNTKQYWRRLRKAALRRNNQLSKLRKF